jgi:hypothetical protein
MDQLEKFVKNHRAEFDSSNPDPGLWNAIEDRLPRKEAKRFPIWKLTAVAAVGLVLILSGVIAGMSMNNNSLNSTAEYIEFREAEQYYNMQLEQRVSALAQYTYDPTIDDDLDELKEVYNELTSELEDGMEPNKNDIIQALIQNYQTRVDLLERVLERLEEGQKQFELSNDDETTKI